MAQHENSISSRLYIFLYDSLHIALCILFAQHPLIVGVESLFIFIFGVLRESGDGKARYY